MTELSFPLAGRMLVVGPSNVGKTRSTARALDAWVAEHGPAGVVVFEFAPEIERDGVLLGGRIARFTTVPDAAWQGVLEARAPRSEGETDAAALALAERNVAGADRLLEAAPSDPTAVFVNDATVALQADASRTDRLTGYCDRADVAVLNAFESDELGVDDPVSRNERDALDRLRSWADRVVELPSP
ncbi:hypothetical protein SAMN04487948_12547 [Halogranum amylolyticum]|uniref:Uncharacterized protein n=1 Tax=Halogranum amylolyticum TaxID=660520 RepID=A0A1H8W8R6_9EURY|nr:hypothetical protein [Halogranum amylolyticum]SEP24030.1 hypothetical protein SAMN04487948_12547 [Halogranum amylolyticum]